MNNKDKAILVSIILIAIITFCLGYILGYGRARAKYSKDTEAIIDSVSKSNNELKFQVKQLDSLKNERIIEVKGLNNDNTYKLFKRLVEE